jgi:hypothetical protein
MLTAIQEWWWAVSFLVVGGHWERWWAASGVMVGGQPGWWQADSESRGWAP